MMKKICATISMTIVLILCLCGCGNTNINIEGVWNLETISNESGKLIAVGETHSDAIDLPRKNIKCDIKADMAVIFTEDELEYKGTYTMEKVSNAKLLHVSLDNGKSFDVTCGEKKSADGTVELSMLFEYEKNIILFSKK